MKNEILIVPARVGRSLGTLSILLTLTQVVGCNGPSSLQDLLQFIPDPLRSQLSAVLGQTPRPTPSASSTSSPAPTPTEDPVLAAAKKAKENAEILREMMQVVLMRDPKDRSEFGNWADTLNQGASLEGVYNGLTHSADYRKLESINSGATIGALKLFGEELAFLEAELSTPTKFDSGSASPLPVLGEAGAGADGGVQVMEFPGRGGSVASPSSQVTQRNESAEKYSKEFVGASIFTLKRVLGDEALKVISSQNQYREKLALWYSKWVVRIAQRNIDFGVPLRNNPDEAFHYKWALTSTSDRIQWEVLNRLHRALNEANKQK